MDSSVNIGRRLEIFIEMAVFMYVMCLIPPMSMQEKYLSIDKHALCGTKIMYHYNYLGEVKIIMSIFHPKETKLMGE